MATAKHAKKPVKKATKRAPKKTVPDSPWKRHERDIWIVALLVLGVFVALAEMGILGPVGHGMSIALQDVFGIGRFALPVLLLGLGVALVAGKTDVEQARFTWGLGLLAAAFTGIGHLSGGQPTYNSSTKALAHGGGWLGVLIGGSLVKAIGMAGAITVVIALGIVGLMVLTGVGLRTIALVTATLLKAVGQRVGQWWTSRPQSSEGDFDEPEEVVEKPARKPRKPRVEEVATPLEDEPTYDEPMVVDYEAPAEVPPPAKAPVATLAPRVHSDYELPPMTMLSRTKEQKQDRTATENAGAQLVAALASHGVETTLVGYTVGPAVTRFELEIGPGVKVAKITSLNKDIAYAMASPDVRILAPIPGRSAIGVEVPNRQRTLVALGDLLAAEESIAATHPLDVPIGRDISGKTVVVNLAEMPHVLISGATGAGKSSCINSLVTSLVMRATPDELGLILIDPKRVEMGQYGTLPHLLAPVVVDPKKAAGVLHWAVKEMERRYDILAESGARDITSYQQMIERGELTPAPTVREQVADAIERGSGLESDVEPARGPEKLSYIVIIVDELNDLMMVAARDVEESVVRIAQMARAVGIHLVLATQRPSVDVITGVIKANVPSRMAFAVSSLADSRVILDQGGAERLIGKGDMLLVTSSSNVARRLQSPWVSEEEVRNIVEFWRAQGGQRENVVAVDEKVSLLSNGSSFEPGGDEDILRQARELVVRNQSGSTSMLQRKLRVGFARAGRIMDQLEEDGIVGPGDGSKARKVLVTQESFDPDNY